MEDDKTIKIKKNGIWRYSFFILVIIAIAVIFLYKNSTFASEMEKKDVMIVDGVQKVVISMKNSNYYPDTIRVKANQPVEISLDSTVKGCLRSFTIPDLRIGKNLIKTNDVLSFTPTQRGSYRFACSMNMGYGKLIVE